MQRIRVSGVLMHKQDIYVTPSPRPPPQCVGKVVSTRIREDYTKTVCSGHDRAMKVINS